MKLELSLLMHSSGKSRAKRGGEAGGVLTDKAWRRSGSASRASRIALITYEESLKSPLAQTPRANPYADF